MKSRALVIIGIMLISALALSPTSVAQEYEYKELNPVHVINTSAASDITCWGENLAWVSGWGNITTGTVTGGAGSVIDAQSWANDMVMSGSAIVWSAAATDVTTRSDIYTTGISGGSKTFQPFNTEYDEISPRIDGTKVLYESMQEYGTTARVSNLGSGSSTELPINPVSGNYDISGDYVVGMGDYSRLLVCDTSGNILMDYGAGWYAEEGLRISGDYIAYYEVTDFGNGAYITVKNWKTNETFFVTRMEGQPVGLDIEGNFVVFSASKDPLNGGGACMFIYDIQAQKTFRVSQEYAMIYDYAIGDGWITWITRDYGLYDAYYNIYAAKLPAPGAPPADDGSDTIEYPDDPCAQYRFDDGVTTVALDEGIKFTADDGEHRIYARDITDNGATLDVYSDYQTITMTVGETQTVEGLDITLNAVDPTNQTCDVTVKDVANSIFDSGGDGGGFLGLPAPGVVLVIAAFAAIALAVRSSRRKNR